MIKELLKQQREICAENLRQMCSPNNIGNERLIDTVLNAPEPPQVSVEPVVIKTEAETVNTVSANQRAKRWAMMNFDKWNEVTGFVDPHISYYDEITALIEDAVEFGYGVALKQPLKEIMKVIKKSEGSL